MRLSFSTGITAAAIAVSVSVGISGCGVINQLSAKQKVSTAMSSFSDASSATFTLSLDTTSKDIAAISEAAGDPVSASDLKVLDRFLAGDVQYSIQAADGKKLGQSSGAMRAQPDLKSLLDDPAKFSAYLKQLGNFSMAVRLSGDALVELRMVGGVVYARAAVPKILQLAGEDPSMADQELRGLPPELAPLSKAAKGGWISVDLAKLASTLKSSGTLDGLPSSAPTPSINAGAVNKLLTDLQAAYDQKVTITELGDSDRGQGFRLSVPAKQVAAAVQDDVIAIVGDAAAADVKKGIGQIPDRTFSLDVWTKDDKLSGVALDLTQFLDSKPAGSKLAIDVAVDVDSGKVTAPSGATPLDVQALMDEITSIGSGLGGGSSGSGFDDGLGGLGSLDGSAGSLDDFLQSTPSAN